MRIGNNVLGIAVIAGALALGTARSAAPTTFVVEYADAPVNANVGQHTSTAVDGQGNPHVTYYDLTNGNLKYARRSGGVWTRETADGSVNAVGLDTSIEIDANGNPQVSYYDFTTADLKFAWKSGGVWTREIVDGSASNVGRNTSLELDALGNPHISYYDATTTDLKYAWKSGGVWMRETADATTDNVGQQGCLALDAAGNPHISYLNQTKWLLKHAWKSLGVWSVETADSGSNDEAVFPGKFTSLAIDAGGGLHVSYVSTSGITGNALRYARKEGGGWTREFADSSAVQVGQFSSLALDAQGNPHVAYEDFTNNNVRYARKSGGSWTIQFVDSLTNSGKYTSLALDASGRPHVAYEDLSSGLGSLSYAAGSAPTGVAPSAAAIRSLEVLPNPIAGGEASIRFEVRPGTPIDLAIYDVSGRRVSTIAANALGSGTMAGTWTGLDASNRRLAPGVYLLRLVAGNHVESKRVTVVR